MANTVELDVKDTYHAIQMDSQRYEKLCKFLDNYDKPKKSLWKRLLLNKLTISMLVIITLITIVAIVNLIINIPFLLELFIYLFIVVPSIIFIMYLIADDKIGKIKARKYAVLF